MKQLLLILFVFLSFASHAQDVRYIKLKQTHVEYRPVNYHITGVADDRANTNTIGVMKFGIMNKRMSVDLRNGVTNSLENFIKNNVTQDASTPAVTLHITRLEVSEKDAGMREEADVSIALAFYYGETKLVEYTGSGYQQTSLDASPYVEKLIRTTLENSLKQFDGWVASRPGILSAPSVKINVVMGTTTDDPDELPFTTHPTLAISDFTGRPDPLSVAAAETYSGMGISYSSQREGGHVTVQVVITPYFDKNKSWCKPNYKNARTLAHEQIHLDITAINTCALVHALETAEYTPENYIQKITQLHKEYMKMTETEQDQYDGETHHGLISKQQNAWEKKVKQQLSSESCYQ